MTHLSFCPENEWGFQERWRRFDDIGKGSPFRWDIRLKENHQTQNAKQAKRQKRNHRIASFIWFVVRFQQRCNQQPRTIFLVLMLIKSKTRNHSVSYILIISGALGNIFDRVERGAVVDFIELHYKVRVLLFDYCFDWFLCIDG